MLLLGTTGEGILLSLNERKAALDAALQGPLPVLAHCGAQTTADTVALAGHAAAAGAEAVAVIAPPYFRFDEDELLAHFAAAAHACSPLPFYVYELEKASGYAIPVSVVERLRDRIDNLAGMKVSDAPFEKVQPYLLEGLDVFIGAEALIGQGLAGRRRRSGLRPRVGLPGGRRRGRPDGRFDRRRGTCGRRSSGSRGTPH